MPTSTETSSLINEGNIDFAKKKAKEAGKEAVAYAKSVANGNASIRGMALVGGIILMGDSISNVITHIICFEWISACIDFYAFIFGACAVVMESDKEAIPYANKLRGMIGKNFGIVRTVTGRGLFYGVAATLEMSEDNYRSNVIGYAVLFVGIAYIILGHTASAKIKALRNKKYPDWKVKRMFDVYDKDKSGRIEFHEFQNLLKDMNVDLALQEAELIYLSLDKDMNHGLCLEEFQRFWANSDELNTFSV